MWPVIFFDYEIDWEVSKGKKTTKNKEKALSIILNWFLFSIKKEDAKRGQIGKGIIFVYIEKKQKLYHVCLYLFVITACKIMKPSYSSVLHVIFILFVGASLQLTKGEHKYRRCSERNKHREALVHNLKWRDGILVINYSWATVTYSLLQHQFLTNLAVFNEPFTKHTMCIGTMYDVHVTVCDVHVMEERST